MSGQLDAFLKGGNPDGEASPAPERPASRDERASGTTPEAPRTPPEAAPAKDIAPAKAPPAPEPDDDADPGEAEPGQPVVPRRAYETERAKRQNWVERGNQGPRLNGTRWQSSWRRRAKPAASTGHATACDDGADRPRPRSRGLYPTRAQGVVLNERLEHVGNDGAGQARQGSRGPGDGVFPAANAGRTQDCCKPSSTANLHPYQWMIDNNATARLHEEIGTDPAAYEQKLRAKWESERGADPPPVSPAAGLPPSLANARSSAPRSSNGFAGPMAMEDILRRPERKR